MHEKMSNMQKTLTNIFIKIHENSKLFIKLFYVDITLQRNVKYGNINL